MDTDTKQPTPQKKRIMAFNFSDIEWTTFSLGFWEGCDKVSQGCKYCYAEREVKGRWGRQFLGNVRRTGEATWKAPERIHKQLTGAEPFTERLVFLCPKSDFFHEDADAWRAEAWEIIKKTPNLIYQILTKRDGNIASRLPDDWGLGYPNVWLGVSCEDNKNAHRIETLAGIPAAVRFVSFEPLIESIDLNLDISTMVNIHWAILGGESGNDKPPYIYRPCELDWLRSLKRQMESYGIPVFVKQLGTYLAKVKLKLPDRHGRIMEQFPKDLQVREWPQELAMLPAENQEPDWDNIGRDYLDEIRESDHFSPNYPE